MILSLKNIEIKYAESFSIKITENFSSGEVVRLEGKNGSGKTSIFNAIMGFYKTYIKADISGNVFLNDMDISDMDTNKRSVFISYVFADDRDNYFLGNVKSELAFALENQCLPKNEILNRIAWVSESLKINHLLNKNPLTLSGGERSLVAVASAVITRPKFLLIDEVFTAMDTENKNLIIKLLNSLHDVGIIIVDHKEYMPCDRVVKVGG